MVSGVGGRLGPELGESGRPRIPEYLRTAIRRPSVDIPEGFRSVVAVTRDGRRIRGIAKNEDIFSLQLLDLDERLHLLRKDDLQEVIHERESLMPAYDETRLPESELEDLLAYLTRRGGS